jgi:hypothetical protein
MSRDVFIRLMALSGRRRRGNLGIMDSRLVKRAIIIVDFQCDDANIYANNTYANYDTLIYMLIIHIC